MNPRNTETAKAAEELLQHLIVPPNAQSIKDTSTVRPEPKYEPNTYTPQTSSFCDPPIDPPSKRIQRVSSTNTPAHTMDENPQAGAGVPVPELQPYKSNVISLEEFEAENLPALEALEAHLREKRMQKSTSKPTPQVVPSGPIPLRSPQTASQFVPLFNSMCQSKNINAVFDFYTPSGEFRALKGSAGGSPGFGAKVTFAGQEVKDDGPYGSKKIAKERVAEKALGILKEIQVPGPEPMNVDEENWIGLLGEYAQSIASPLPEYKLFELPPMRFSAEVALATHPSEVFGNRDLPSPSKKAAKASAAKAAIEWLRGNGLLNGDPPRKKKKAASQVGSPDVASPSPPTSSPLSNSPAPMGAGSVLQANDLARSLGFDQPEYDLKQSNEQGLGLAFWNCHAYFPNSPKMPSTIGLVRNVFGKKNAKEECARGVMEFLRALQEQRQSRAQALIDAAQLQGASG